MPSRLICWTSCAGAFHFGRIEAAHRLVEKTGFSVWSRARDRSRDISARICGGRKKWRTCVCPRFTLSNILAMDVHSRRAAARLCRKAASVTILQHRQIAEWLDDLKGASNAFFHHGRRFQPDQTVAFEPHSPDVGGIKPVIKLKTVVCPRLTRGSTARLTSSVNWNERSTRP